MFRKLLLTALVSVMVGCGGAGGGSNGTNGSTNALTGVAAKGLLSGADVQAFEVTSSGLVAIGTVKKTGTDGSYSLADLPITANPVIVKITVNASTTMLDEITGQTINAGRDLPVGFSMRSFVPDLTTSNEVHIQPFTELAIAAAESSGKALSGETLSAGKEVVVQLLGVSPFSIKPRDPAEVSTMSNDEKKMMLFLAGVAQDSKTASCSNSTGTSCALEKLKSEVKISYDPATKTAIPDPTKMATLKAKVDNQVTTAKTELTSKRPGPFATAMNSTATTTGLPGTVNVAESLVRDGLEGFITSMRTGFATAEKSIKDRAAKIESRIKNATLDSVKDGFDLGNILKYNCSKITKTTTPSQFICSSSSPQTTFTKTADGKYSFTHHEQAIIPGSIQNPNLQTVYTGEISYELTNSQYLVKVKASGTYLGKKLADFDIQLKVIDSLTEESVEFVKFDATRWDQATGSNLYATVSLVGLRFSQNPSDSTMTITGTVPIKVSTSDGDGFSGSISDVKLRETASGGYPYQLTLKGALFAKEGNLVNLEILVKRSSTYDDSSADSSSNFEDAYANIIIDLADNVSLGIEADEISLTDTSLNVKVTSNKNWIKLSATEVKNLTSFKTSIKDNTVKVTSSGEYSATLVKSNGQYNGDLFKGTSKIGEISNGIIKTGGREISLK